ncbi:MAG: glycoside hydrolase family 13 protein [Tannerellaceae bacterium]|jgi:glycosidase|nr:glycoside hydrolase family 13 protein [Tannerellaceae bacterium]
MSKKVFFILLLLSLSLRLVSQNIDRIEPMNWWVGMKNTELQLLVYGKDIAAASFSLDYPGVVLKEVVRVENPNYMFVYLDVLPEARPGTIALTFTAGKKKSVRQFELRERSDKSGALGFSRADVMYLITPDRFVNGDTRNDNMLGVTVDRSQPYGRHGGDLKGIADKLDYIRELGFTTIWLNPVLENGDPRGSYHGYAITDFYKVDPRFGTNEEYRRLVSDAHSRGMKVVMDMIFNHCGAYHWWMKDLPTRDWLNDYEKYGNTTHYKWTLMDIHAVQTETDRVVNGWFSRGMPDLNQRNRHLARYLIQNSIWWIEYSRIDGIRQDTHPYADYDFMAQWCLEVEREYPDFNIVGEAWYPKISASAWWQRRSVNNSMGNSRLKTVMDFDLTFTLQQALDEESNTSEGSESGLFKVYEVIAQDFLFPDPDNILTFLDNHDISRFMRKDETDLRRYKQGLALLLTTRGIPQIYYGTEILMHGTKKEGDGLIRKDYPGGWQGDPADAFAREGRTDLQNEAWSYMQGLLKWRQTSLPVTQGRLKHYTPDRSGVYVYARYTDTQTVLVMINGSGEERTLDMSRFSEVISGSATGRDIITEQIIDLREKTTIPAKGVYIMELSK